MRADLLDDVALRWQELRTVELFWDEISDEIAGKDPVAPETRMKAKDVSTLLRALSNELGGNRHHLQEPTTDMVAEARNAVDEAFRQVEPLL